MGHSRSPESIDSYHVRRRMPAKQDAITCVICGRPGHLLHLHVRRRHGLTDAEYLALPGARLVSDHFYAIAKDKAVDQGKILYWTPERIVERLLAYQGAHRRRPTKARWKGPPSVPVIQLRFGTWSAALDAAGIAHNGKSWTKDTCKRGHARTPENLYWQVKNGTRYGYCKRCLAITIKRGNRKQRQRRRAARKTARRTTGGRRVPRPTRSG